MMVETSDKAVMFETLSTGLGSAGPPGDELFDSVFLLASMDTTLATPEVGPDPTVAGNSTISADPVQFGAGCLELDGGGDYLAYPHQSEFTADGDFTYECWFQQRSTNSVYSTIAAKRVGSSSQTSDWNLWIHDSISNVLDLFISNSAGGALARPVGTTSIVLDQWYHVAITRVNSTKVWTIYLDGAVEATATESGTPKYLTGFLYVGHDNSDNARDMDGFIDDVRLTTAVRYTEAFTPPTLANPLSGDAGGGINSFLPTHDYAIRSLCAALLRFHTLSTEGTTAAAEYIAQLDALINP